MYRYVFFDLDGTITEPAEGIYGGILYALERFGITVADRDSLAPYIGPPLRDSFREFQGFSAEQAERAVGYYREYYSTKGILQNELMPGMRTAFRRLEQAGCKLYVATSKPELFARQILEYLDLSSYFQVIAGSSMDGSRDNKVAVLQYLLEQIGVERDSDAIRDIVMVGDRKFDVLGAQEFGIDQIGVLFGYGSREEFEACNTRFVVETAEEMTDIILRER